VAGDKPQHPPGSDAKDRPVQFGKGRIQDIVELDGGGAFKFTYAEYLTPNGFALDGVGLTPDIAARPEQTSVLDPSFNTAVETMFGILR
jgi:carboxyl-terminal processing protease